MFESINEWFNRLEMRTERESARLRKLERWMQDYVGRPNAHSWANGSALFEEAQGYIDRVDDIKPGRRSDGRSEAKAELASMAAAEALRSSFRPKRPKAKHLSHVRPVRPVPPALVGYAASLGVSV